MGHVLMVCCVSVEFNLCLCACNIIVADSVPEAWMCERVGHVLMVCCVLGELNMCQ